jgi:DNA polymerase-1
MFTIVVDSNYVCWTSAFAASKGLSYVGTRTEVIYLFLKQLFSIFENFEPAQAIFCWDSRASKRKEIYPEYKANRRKDISEEDKEALNLVYEQFTELKSYILPAMGFSNVFEVAGYESDDLIASTVINQTNPEKPIVISSDSDLYQLLDHCSIYAITKAQTMSKEIFTRQYGITPQQWVMVKAIAGCGTDNVKGIGGIGEKKAIGYLTGKLNHGKMFLKIENSMDIVDRNLRLVGLPFAGTPVPKMHKNSLTIAKLQEICKTYGMASLVEKKNLLRWEKIISRID